jgi:hypothetical protein
MSHPYFDRRKRRQQKRREKPRFKSLEEKQQLEKQMWNRSLFPRLCLAQGKEITVRGYLKHLASFERNHER